MHREPEHGLGFLAVAQCCRSWFRAGVGLPSVLVYKRVRQEGRHRERPCFSPPLLSSLQSLPPYSRRSPQPAFVLAEGLQAVGGPAGSVSRPPRAHGAVPAAAAQPAQQTPENRRAPAPPAARPPSRPAIRPRRAAHRGSARPRTV